MFFGDESFFQGARGFVGVKPFRVGFRVGRGWKNISEILPYIYKDRKFPSLAPSEAGILALFSLESARYKRKAGINVLVKGLVVAPDPKNVLYYTFI